MIEYIHRGDDVVARSRERDLLQVALSHMWKSSPMTVGDSFRRNVDPVHLAELRHFFHEQPRAAAGIENPQRPSVLEAPDKRKRQLMKRAVPPMLFFELEHRRILFGVHRYSDWRKAPANEPAQS